MPQQITNYLQEIQHAVQVLSLPEIEAVVDRLFAAYVEGNNVYTMGNGASAALASHMACDLGKGTSPDLGRGPVTLAARRLRITSLNDNVALLTAYGNDIDYCDIFLEQLKNLLEPDDIVIGISGSGGSRNVLRAMSYARTVGATTIGLTGAQPTATKLIQLCDLFVQAPLTQMEQIEDLHVIVHHVIGLSLRERIAGQVREVASMPLASGDLTEMPALVNPGD